ncbi:MAG TPA: sulfatase-like hydrolase/transferase [Sphingobacteriaceae bacterium]|nr:sulfatase-like hydrolase/transferase [Sphingobacteriaceae bacterium]
MLKTLQVLLRFVCFWLIFFFIDRSIFLIFFSDKLAVSPHEVVSTYVNGLRLDFSTAVYISAIPLLIYIVLWLFPRLKLSTSVPRAYVYITISLITLISVINLNIYREWGSKVNYRAFQLAFSSPNEAFASAASSPLFLSVLIAVLMIFIGIWLSKRIIQFTLPDVMMTLWVKVLSALLFITMAGLIIRGGWQLAPINPSMAYFSNKPILNHAAVNTHWNLLHDWLKKSAGDNPYKYFPQHKANALVHQLYAGKGEKSIFLLTTQRPNVVLIILESFTADIIESLGGEKGITPGIDKLVRSGVLFTNIYASGDRTDKGLTAILSGFPSQAIRSIVKENNKHEKLPAIAADLQQTGYYTSFFYGGESEFSNMKSYILSHGFDNLVDQNSFKAADKNSKWGTHDHIVFKRQLTDLSKHQQPFFSTLLTLSNHEPFELPGNPHYPGPAVENKFRSTAFYTDSVLHNYIEKAKQTPWYNNTLFIIVADHGHRLPGNKYESFNPGRYRIPLIFFGNVIKEEFRGKKLNKIGSQTDIATTLLSQLNISSEKYKWGQNLLNTSKEFAFFNWDNGFGIVTPEQSTSFDNVGKHVIYRRKENYSKNDSLVNMGKAYMQSVFQQYINY